MFRPSARGPAKDGVAAPAPRQDTAGSETQSTALFHSLAFIEGVPLRRNAEDGLSAFLNFDRRAKQEKDVAKRWFSENDCFYEYEIVERSDIRRIKRRAVRAQERLHSSTGLYLSSDRREPGAVHVASGGVFMSKVATE